VKSLLVVLGPSGAGKSSFLRAGLLPRLRREDRRFLPLGIVPQRLPLIAQTCSLAVAELRCHRCGVPDGIPMAAPKHE
jgi:ABC-type arginine transport system ATPase subunit